MQKHVQVISIAGSTAALLVGFWLLRTQLVLSDALPTITVATEITSGAVAIAHITSPIALICVALFAAFLAVETHHIHAWLQIVISLLITVGVCWLMKEATQLHRPANAQLITTGLSEYAFPSTHAASAGTVAVLVGFHARRLTGLARTAIYTPLSLGVFVVGASRLVLGAHTISDVLAGLVLGTSLGLLAVMTWPRLHQFLCQLHERQREIT